MESGLASRKYFLLAIAAVLLAPPWTAPTAGQIQRINSVTAITEVFGDGQRLTAVAVEFDKEIDGSKLAKSTFAVEGRTVTDVLARSSANLGPKMKVGKFVIIELSPDDANAPLYIRQHSNVIRKEAKALVTQTGPVVTVDGTTYNVVAEARVNDRVENLIVDEFRQFAFTDPKTGLVLNYNLFVPKTYDATRSYPLVLFMHDAGATSTVTDTTLVQGLGAVVWASPDDQRRREAFVLAPQYATQIVNDKSEASSFLDVTVELLKGLCNTYSIDKSRLYTTGQSGGAMMAIAMSIRHPDLFAASFLVAGQWDPSLVKPLAKQRLWVVVSEGDLKAYPGQNAIMTALQQDGAKVSRAVWSGRSTPNEFSSTMQAMEAEGSPINYVVLRKGTVVLPGQDDDGGSNHINTWRIAYQIEGIRDWIFRQHK